MNTLPPLPIIILLLFVLALASFFFSASETAIIALSKIRLRHLISKGVKHAQAVQGLLTKSDKFITTILVGNNFVNVAFSSVVTTLFVAFLGNRIGIIAATFTTTIFILIFCEITPKILATKHTEKIALFVAPIMNSVTRVFHPLSSFFSAVSNFILRLFGMDIAKRSPLITEEELRLMIEVGKEEGVLSEEERKMLHRIFEFGDTKVETVMAPKDKIIAVNAKATSDELLNIFVEQGHSRLPVYDNNLDSIIGIVYARDLLYILRDNGLFVLHDLLHEPYFVSSTMKVNELLRRFQQDKIQIAVVRDSNKKTLGIVTLEDLIEEIVGELEEEHGRRTTKKH